MKVNQKRILVAPLDWGLGHASRCIPVIEALLKAGAEVVVAADRRPLKLLAEAFPQLEKVRLPGMDVSYPKHLPMSLYMVLKAPKFLATVSEENQMLDKIIKNYNIDGIISDNRYGVYSQDVPSVLITHQLFIQAPIISPALHKFIAHYVKKFDHCWVPDFEGENNLSGALSHQDSNLKNVNFIGPLSRFQTTKANKDQSYKRKLMAIVSGPEPSRTDFEKLLSKELQKLDLPALVVKGLVGEKLHTSDYRKGNIEYCTHLNRAEMKQEIMNSEIVICRSGYSSVMDLVALNKKAVLVPTPGQTEQEYLADYLKSKGWFYSQKEGDFNLKEAMSLLDNYQVESIESNDELLSGAIEKFLSEC
jgi:uncharacterized protein (TIGR00661 family)